MNLARLAQEAAQKKSPIKVGLIGAGKFGSMFLSQLQTIKGLEVPAISALTFACNFLAVRSVGKMHRSRQSHMNRMALH